MCVIRVWDCRGITFAYRVVEEAGVRFVDAVRLQQFARSQPRCRDYPTRKRIGMTRYWSFFAHNVI